MDYLTFLMGFGSSWLRFAFAHLLSLELQVVIWFIPSKLNIALTYVMAHIYTHHHKPRFSVRWICRICCVVVECALGCQEHVNMNMHGHGSCRSVLGIMLTLPMFCFGRCKSIQRWDFNFEIIQPWYWSYFPCQDEPMETCRIFKQPGYISTA